jgi:hypothetical protein
MFLLMDRSDGKDEQRVVDISHFDIWIAVSLIIKRYGGRNSPE